MVEKLQLELADQFAEVAAKTLVRELGYDSARAQVVSLLSEADDDTRAMFEDIIAAIDALRREERLAG